MTAETAAEPDVRLTALAHGGGCGCKLAPSVLQALLAEQPQAGAFAQLLVGTETGDDAAVWQVDEQTCVIATTDFFMPMVDDPRDFGRIAATNAISDVYAMGGRPIMALAVLGMPLGKLPVETVRAILAGGAEVCAEAGIPVAGGHSIDAPEPIYGLAVIGLCRPERGPPQRRRAARRRADPDQGHRRRHLLGRDQEAGARRRRATPSSSPRPRCSTASARDLGRLAAVHAVTDVTGFGLLGHALEMARGCGATLAIDDGAVPLLAQAEALARAGLRHRRLGAELGELRGGGGAARGACPTGGGSSSTDPQTSGGLLVACASGRGRRAARRRSAPEGYPAGAADRRRRGGPAGGARRRLTEHSSADRKLHSHGRELGVKTVARYDVGITDPAIVPGRTAMNIDLSRRAFLGGAGAGVAGTALGAFGFGGRRGRLRRRRQAVPPDQDRRGPLDLPLLRGELRHDGLRRRERRGAGQDGGRPHRGRQRQPGQPRHALPEGRRGDRLHPLAGPGEAPDVPQARGQRLRAGHLGLRDGAHRRS